MNKAENHRLVCYILLLGAGLLVRLTCMAREAFFQDLPASLFAIRSGQMWIQFPGYVPFHFAIKIFALGSDQLLGGAIAFSIACGMLAMFFLMRTAEELGGLRAAVAAGLAAGASVFLVYFSGVGSSYITDTLAMAGALYYGMRAILRQNSPRNVVWAFCWCGFGIVMRPLSAMWLVPGLLWLAWRHAGSPERWWSAGVLAISLVALVGMSAPFYHSWAEFFETTQPVRAVTVAGVSKMTALTLVARLAGFPIYFFHVWLALSLVAIPAAVRLARRDATSFGRVYFPVFLALPYVAILCRHLPQAGYLCLLGPTFVVWPFASGFFERRPALTTRIALVFAVLSLLQIYVVRPGTPRTIPELAWTAYGSQYSRNGIQKSMYETMATLAVKTGVGKKDLSPTRRLEVEVEGSKE